MMEKHVIILESCKATEWQGMAWHYVNDENLILNCYLLRESPIQPVNAIPKSDHCKEFVTS